MHMGNTFKSNLQKIEKLPTLPETARHILDLTNNPLLSIGELQKVVEKDPAITAKILSVANSAFFGLSVQTNMLNDAIMRIGMDNVKNIAVGISVLTLFGEGRITPDYKRLFNHSVIVGLTARSLAKKFRAVIGEDILIDGLLHDLGYLVLNRYFPDIYQKTMNAFKGSMSILDVEKDIISYSHSEVGFWLAEQWKLPSTVLDTILYHHTPSLAKNNAKRVAVIHIADYVVSQNTFGPIEKNPNYPLNRGSYAMLGISDNDLNDIEGAIRDNPFADEVFGQQQGTAPRF
jgi:putative nucleotidyltransferase with HDIG domain